MSIENPVSTNNIGEYLTVGIKTFHRPKCLEHCIKSIQDYSNNIRILVADDSDDTMKSKNREITERMSNVTVIDLPFNSGLSYGRNRLVAYTTTPYFLNLDDDNYIDENTNLVKAINFLEANRNYDLLAGVCPNRGVLYGEMSISYSKCFESIQTINGRKTITTKPNSVKVPNSFLTDTYITHLTLNLFLARTRLLKLHPWNEDKKLGEHEEFFVNLYHDKIHCVISHEIVFGELIDERRDYEYDFPDNSIHNTYTREYSLL